MSPPSWKPLDPTTGWQGLMGDFSALLEKEFDAGRLPVADLAASFQAAVVDVLVQDDWWFDREALQAKLPIN